MPELAWFPVKSSNVAAVAYDATTSTLYVKFKSGPTWKYAPVPESVYTTFFVVPSAGRYFAEAVKGRYQGEAL